LATGRFEPLDLVTGFFDGIGVSSITSRLRVTAPIITTNRYGSVTDGAGVHPGWRCSTTTLV
jgi:hypothetical protein